MTEIKKIESFIQFIKDGRNTVFEHYLITFIDDTRTIYDKLKSTNGYKGEIPKEVYSFIKDARITNIEIHRLKDWTETRATYYK